MSLWDHFGVTDFNMTPRQAVESALVIKIWLQVYRDRPKYTLTAQKAGFRLFLGTVKLRCFSSWRHPGSSWAENGSKPAISDLSFATFEHRIFFSFFRFRRRICSYLFVFACICEYLVVFGRICSYLLVFARICSYSLVFASICSYCYRQSPPEMSEMSEMPL